MDKTIELDKQTKQVLGITFILFILIRVLGAFFLDNNWSFTHLFYIPAWYYIVPISICLLLFYLIQLKSQYFEQILDRKDSQIYLCVIFIVFFIVFQFDSFAYGGGNYKINQIAQVDNIIYRFYEYGTIFAVSMFYKIFSLFDLEKTSAGLYSWKLFSYIGTILTFYASVLLSKTISNDSKNRIYIFFIIFFGPQTLSYFGFVGNTSFIAAALYFFIYFGLQFDKNRTLQNIGILWAVALVAVCMHLSLLVLVPALLFVTFKKFLNANKAAFILGIISHILLTITVYLIAFDNFAYAKPFLFIKGQNMRVYYNLLSFNHILDFMQLFLLFVPQIIVVKFLFFKNRKTMLSTFKFQLIMLLVISSNTFLFISEPIHSIILDAPLFAVYFSPIVVLFAMLIAESVKSLKYASIFALFIPLLVLPSYLSIDRAEKQVESYLEKNHFFYIEGSTALQDSYFYSKRIEKANYWYVNLPKKSRDFLDLTAAGEYNYAAMYPNALKLYHQLKLKSKFWGEPRYHIASIYMKQSKFKQARPEIDTCLMIDPYEKEYLKLDYSYYRDIGEFNRAKKHILSALSIYPHNIDYKTDLAIIYYRLKDIQNAEQTAKDVIENDSTQAYAYLILGFIAEIKKQPTQAITYFEKFIQLAPEEPESPDIRKRLNNLILEQRTS